MKTIPLNDEDVREALRLLRHKLVAEQQLQLFMEQMAALYKVPAGYTIHDFLIGFVPVERGIYD